MSKLTDSHGPDVVLDYSLLEQYRVRKSRLLERLIPAYLAEAPTLFNSIRAAATTQDLDGLKLNTHALKSCSGNLGAVRLSGLCQQLEDAVNESDHAAIHTLLELMGPASFDAEESLRVELSRAKRDAGEPVIVTAPKPDAEAYEEL